MKVRTRFAPSPTGYLHIGGVRTALFSWLYARKHGGDFILRIEDTDLARSTKESVDVILQGMEWLGLDYDEGPFYQTQRMERYTEVIQQLLDNGQAYYCYCTKEELDTLRAEQIANKQKPRYDGRYRDFNGTPPQGVEPVIRFKNPLEGEVVIDDLIKGPVTIRNSELDDLIIARPDGTPTYNFCVVIDDLDMEITHVIRGDDHLNNTPRQINIFNALGAPLPKFAHVAMILGEDGKRLSKRHGAVNVLQYRDQGYLPQALINYLVRLGWSHGDQELFSREEMINLFSLEAVNSGNSTFSPKKLLWVNEQYIKTGSVASLEASLRPMLAFELEGGPDITAVIEALRDRSKTLIEMAEACKYFYLDPESYDEKAKKKFFKGEVNDVFSALLTSLDKLEKWEAEALHGVVKTVAADLDIGMGKVGMPLRVALTGNSSSPDIGLTLALIGKESVLRRINSAISVDNSA